MMNKVINYLVVAVSIGGLTFAGDLFASDNSDNPQSNIEVNDVKRNNRLPQLAAQRMSKSKYLFEQLNLDASQQEQMQAIKAKYQPQMRTMKEDIRSQRAKLASMIKNNDSQSDLRSQHDNITELGQKMHNLRFEAMLEMLEVLNPEQKEQWAELMTSGRQKLRSNQDNPRPQ